MSALDSFTPLEDLIQVIYQGLHRFVLLSEVDYDSLEPSWNVHLGLADDGRWWKGKWVEKDVHDFIGSSVSSDLLASFAQNIANMVVSGELFVSNWSTEKGAEIKVVFGPSEKRPLSIPLTEMSSEEAAKFVANEFLSLALNAQARKCRLNPPAFAEIPTTRLHSPPRTRKGTSKSPPPSSKPPTTPEASIKSTEERSNIAATKVQEPEAVKKKVTPEPTPAEKSKASGAAPRKKARKVQQMEFGDDDE